MSEEFPEKVRKIGKNEMEPFGLTFDGHAGYKINVKMRPNENRKIYGELKKYFKTLGYELPRKTEAPLVMIPSIKKAFAIIIGKDFASIYPTESKYDIKGEHERSEFKKFLKDFEGFFESL